MQAETIEIEDIEITDSTAKVKKEYEKILQREKNRELNMKAQNLVKLGCFDQKEETNVDFSRLDKITYDKLYRKIYDLYIDKEGNMFYIFGKIEGDNSKPYAYDVIAIENVSDEDYKAVYRAHKYEGAGMVFGMYVASFIIWILSIVIALSIALYYVIQGAGVINTLINCISFLFFIAILTCCLAITSITYRKYIGK